ncbi:hypothetical protein ACMS1Z_06830 [Acidiphilium multivorum]|uniref:hypothetical protein n=1 Tax=Acidiphilium multivorum TaxID=62140 RepID=UPI0039C9A96C
MTTTPEYSAITDWCQISGMTRTATYYALARGELRAKKCGRRVLIHVPTGLAYIDALPDATFNIKAPKAA